MYTVCFKAFFHFKNFTSGSSWQRVTPLRRAPELQNGAQVNRRAPSALMRGAHGDQGINLKREGFAS